MVFARDAQPDGFNHKTLTLVLCYPNVKVQTTSWPTTETATNAHSIQPETTTDTTASCLTAREMRFSPRPVDAEHAQSTLDQLTTVSIAELITAVMMKYFKEMVPAQETLAHTFTLEDTLLTNIVKHAQDGIDQTTPELFASKINA